MSINVKTAKAKIDKMIYTTVVGGVQDSVSDTLMNAVKSGHVKVEQSELPKLLMLMKQSVEAGYQKASRTVSKQIDDALNG